MPDHEGLYLAEPSGPGRAGVLVLHDWYGLLPHVRTACDELAAAGLVALAPRPLRRPLHHRSGAGRGPPASH
jgi:dienelactone hydrolase